MRPPASQSPPVSSLARHTAELLLAVLALVVVALLAVGVHLDPHVDLAVVAQVHGLAATFDSAAIQAVTDLAASQTVLALTVLCAALLVLRRHWHGALALTVSVAACQAVVALIKHLVARGRPPGDDALVHAGGYSFPSAHSATSVAFYGVLGLIAAHELRGGLTRRSAIAAAGLVCAAVGVSRVYLGAHYPTDVLAGWLVGCVIALGSWRAALALRAAV